MPQRTGIDIFTFLQHYQMYPCLWNKNHAGYKSRQMREQAEMALLPISGLTSAKELRQKMRNIRCTYNQELAKIRRSINAGASEVYKPKLAWFAQADSFLRVNHLDNFEDPNMKIEQTYSTPPGSLAVETHSTVSNSTVMNEFGIFGQHVASQLQQLPLEEAVRLEAEIQSSITRARLRSIQDE